MRRLRAILLLACVMACALQAQAQLRLTLTVSAKPSPYLSDWATKRETAMLTIMNPGSAAVEAKLRAKVSVDGAMKAETKTSVVPGLSVPPGVSTYYADQLLPSDAISFAPGVERTAAHTGMLPAGVYELCVDLVDPQGQRALSQPVCRNFQLTSYQLPVLLAPENNRTLARNEKPAFRWTPIAPAPQGGARYRLRIFEVLRGKTPASMLRSGELPVYEAEIVGRTQFFWPPDFVPSGEVQAHAWSVQAIDEKGQPIGEHDGWAEPFTFVFPTAVEAQSDGRAKKSEATPEKVIVTAKLTNIKSTITGKLVWAFRKSEMAANFPNPVDVIPATNYSAEASLVGMYEKEHTHAQYTPGGSHAGTQKPGQGSLSVSAQLQNNQAAIFGGGLTSMVGVSDLIAGEKNYSTPGEPGTLTKPGEWKPLLEAYAAEDRYPLTNVTVKLSISTKTFTLPPGVPEPSGNTQIITIGSVTTDKNGEFSFAFVDRGHGDSPVIEIDGVEYKFSSVRLEVSEPHFLYEEQRVPVLPAEGKQQHWTLPTVLALANTYRLKVKATELQTKAPILNPTVEVYRPMLWYLFNPNTVKEGTIPLAERPSRTMAGFFQFMIGKTTAPHPVPRLFQNVGGPADRYYLRVSAPGYDTLVTYISAITGGGYWSAVTTVEKEFKLSRAKPIVYGRIVEKDSKAPVPKAGISLTGKNHSYETMSDADGRFTMSGIEPESDAYELEVIANGIKKTYTEKIFLDALGKTVKRDPLEIDVTGNPLKGLVVDEDGQPVAGAMVHWTSGGDPFPTNEKGVFASSNLAGKHGIKIWKPGYFDLDTIVSVQTIPKPSSKGGAKNEYKSSAGPQNFYGPFVLKRRIGRLLVTVRDAQDDAPVPGARVVLADFDDLGLTAAAGTVYFPKAPGGPVKLRVFGSTGTMVLPPTSKASSILLALGNPSPPVGAPDYALYTANITVSDEGDTTRVDVSLARGARVSGSVTTASQPVQDALVRVDGIDELFNKSDGSGKYTIVGVPIGAQTLKAGKQGMIGDIKTADLAVGLNTIDFTLGTAGFDITTIYGFPVIIESMTPGPDTTLSGAFVEIPKNAVFSLAPGTMLPFSELKISVLGGKAEPKGGKVVTDASEIAARAFDKMPLVLRADEGIEVVKAAGGGQILARVNLDLGLLLQSVSGVSTAAPKALYLVTPALANASPPPAIPVFVSGGALPFGPDGLVFGKGSVSFDVYGFSLAPDLAKSALRTDGLHLAGKVSLNGVPMLGNTSLSVTDLWIDYSGTVKQALVSLTPKPSLTLGSWKLALDAVNLTQNGFFFGGSLEFTLPQSGKSTIAVSDLIVTSEQIYGGKLLLPAEGIDVFSVLKIKSNGAPFAFGSVGSSGPMFISGGGTFTLSKFDKSLTLESFEVRTDGNFSALAAVNCSVNFANMAKFTLNTLGFSTIGTPKVEVGGELGLNIPMVSVTVGGQFSYAKGGGFTMKKVKLGFSIPAATVETELGWGNNYFTGKGKLIIASTPLNLEFQLTYSSTSFSADFMAGIPPIQIGYVTLMKIGGGFGYWTDPNTNSKKYRITVKGAFSIAGTGALLAIDPLEVTVESGPVIRGSATVTLVGQPVANSTMVMDFPQKRFTVEGWIGGTIIPDLNLSVSAKSLIVISAKDGDSYWGVGFAGKATMLSIINSTANVFIGSGVNRVTHPEYNTYTSFIPSEFLTNGTTVNGAHVSVISKIGASGSGNFLDIASGSIWYSNESETAVHMNFVTNTYALGISSSWSGGGSLTIAGKSVAGLAVTAGGGIAGSYSPSNGWSFCAKIGGSVIAWIGDCSSACANKICWCGCFNPCWPWESCKVCPIPCGGKLCVSAEIQASYTSKSGLDCCVKWPAHDCSLCP